MIGSNSNRTHSFTYYQIRTLIWSSTKGLFQNTFDLQPIEIFTQVAKKN